MKKFSYPMQFHLRSPRYNRFKRCFLFAGYQPVLSGQQGFQGLVGVQQPPQSQGVMSSQQGAPVQSVMVSYPAVSNYQVRVRSLGNSALKSRTCKAQAVGVSPSQMGGRWQGVLGAVVLVVDVESRLY